MMVTVKVESISENKETIKSLLLGGLFEENHLIIFALSKANIAIKKKV